RDAWRVRDKSALVEALAGRLVNIRGITTNCSQPIKDNVDEALAGVKGELGIKLYGPDLFVLEDKAREITGVLAGIRGVADLDYDHLVGQPQLQIVVDRKAAARYGINVQDIEDAIEVATRGRVVTQVFEGERRFDLAVRLASTTDSLATLKALTVSAPSGERIPLTQRALARLYVIVPLVIFIIFILLFGAFQSIGDALLIMLNLPFALIGGTLALFLWRTTFNISAAVGFVAVFGVSVLNGVVLVSSI